MSAESSTHLVSIDEDEVRLSRDKEAEAWRLLEAAQQGDPHAFGLLYQRYVIRVNRYLLRRLGNQALADDLTSETFVRALRRLHSVQNCGRSVGGWLVPIARNLAIDHQQSFRCRTERLRADPPDVACPARTPEDDVITAITNAELARCIGRLRWDQQRCLMLRFFLGLSLSETALVMNRTQGAIKALQYRAVLSLGEVVPASMC